MNDRRAAIGAIGALVAAVAAPRLARADATSDALADVAKARASMKTLLGTFTQERTIGLLATSVTSAGELTLVRPDRLRWELKPPDAVVYFVGPEGFSYTTPGGGGTVGKAAAGRFAPVLGDMMVLLGGDLEKLRARYDVHVASRSPALVLTLAPRPDDVKRAVKSIELTFGHELWAVVRVVLEEPNGDRSVIVFTHVERDVQVDPAKMRPPK